MNIKKYLPLIVVPGVIFLVLIILTYWKPPQRDVLDGSIWRVVDLNDQDLLFATTLTLRFHNRHVSGSSGCNRFTARYRVTDENIDIYKLDFLTTDDCLNPGIMAQERVFTDYLERLSTFSFSPQELKVKTANGETITFTSMLDE